MTSGTRWPVRIGVSPIAWTNDDLPELGADTPLEVCLAEARAAGYEGIELGTKFPREPEVLVPIVAAYGLRIASGWYGARLLTRSVEAEIEAMADHIGLLRAMGCTVLVFAEVSGAVNDRIGVPLSERPVLEEGDWSAFNNKLTGIAKHIEDQGLSLAYHHHMGTVVETEQDIDRLMAATDETVGLLLDTGHLAYAGIEPLAIAKRYGHRIRHVHCKDVRPDVLLAAKNQNASFLDAVLDGVFTVPGDGAIDFAILFQTLRDANYRGWLVVEAEQDPAKANPLAYARKGHAGLRQAIARAST